MSAVRRGQLEAGAAALGLELGETRIAQLLAYADLLARWNRVFNFVSRRDVERLDRRHLLDSLSGADLVHGDRVLDFGSGAGLPGIPLAIVLTHCEFELCERQARRARFLEKAIRELELAHVSVIAGDETMLPDARYDTIVVRAVEAPAALWSRLGAKLGPGGRLVVYERTHDAKHDEEEVRIPQLQGAQCVRHRRVIPGLDEPHTILEVRAA